LNGALICFGMNCAWRNSNSLARILHVRNDHRHCNLRLLFLGDFAMKKPKLDAAKVACKVVLVQTPNLRYLEIVYSVSDLAKCCPGYAEMAISDLKKSGHIVGDKEKKYQWQENPDPNVVHFVPRQVKKKGWKKEEKVDQCRVIKKSAADCPPVVVKRRVPWLG
jgi:hypothetical protein